MAEERIDANMICRDIEITGQQIHVWTGGAGPAILLLHSAWGDAELSWSRVWDDLCKTFTVAAPDMPGFARSGPTGTTSLAESVRLLKGLLDHLKLDKTIVVGNSFGVAVAIEFASAYPERVAHLVVVNGGHIPFVPPLLRKVIAIRAVERHFRDIMRKMIYSDKAFVKAFPHMAVLPPGFFERIRYYEDKHSRTVFDAVMRQAAPQRPPKAPVTVIWGTGDRLVSLKQSQAIRTWFRNPGYIALAGAGHLPQVEQPREFIEAIRRAGTP